MSPVSYRKIHSLSSPATRAGGNRGSTPATVALASTPPVSSIDRRRPAPAPTHSRSATAGRPDDAPGTTFVTLPPGQSEPPDAPAQPPASPAATTSAAAAPRHALTSAAGYSHRHSTINSA